MDLFLLNLSYVLMLVGLSLRDVLWLRSSLAAAQAIFILYGLVSANTTMVFWNCLFLGSNAFQVICHVRETRPVSVSEDLVRFHRESFPYLTASDFVRLWSRGQTFHVNDGWILEAKTVPLILMFVTEGRVEVVHRGRVVCHLDPGKFLGEMEFITGEELNVSFRAVGTVCLHVWTRQEMMAIGDQNPQLCIRIQGVLGRSALRKLQEATHS